MEQLADILNHLCAHWLECRHHRAKHRTASQRLSFVTNYHQQRNHAAKCSRLSRYLKNHGTL